MRYFSSKNKAFYDSEIHSIIPDDAVSITDELYTSILDGQSQGKIISSDGEGKPTLTDRLPISLEDSKRSYLRLNNNTYEAAIQQHTSAYPQSEKDTWPTQDREIKAWVIDPENALTPWIDAAAAVRGVSREDYLQRTLAKTQQFEQLSAYLTGLRQRYEDQIKSSTTHEQLESIVFNYEI